MSGSPETGGRLTIRGLADHWGLSAFTFLSAVKVLHAAKRLGLCPREDGFRRSTRAFFRSERAQPCMAAFGVAIPLGHPGAAQAGPGSAAGDRVADGLRRFLSTRPEMRRSLKWGRFLPRIVPRGPTDVVRVSFSEQGALTSLRSHFDPRLPTLDPTGADMRAVCRQLVFAYNETCNVGENGRPALLHDRLAGWARKQGRGRSSPDPEIGQCIERLLNAVWVCFEEIPSKPGEPAVADLSARVALPDFTRRRGPGPGGLVVLARIHPGRDVADLWFHFDHAVFDGAPFAEMINSLEREWSVPWPLVLPCRSPAWGLRSKVPCSVVENEDSIVAQDFFDFRPLVRLRKELAVRFAEKMEGEPLSMVGMLVWGLAQQQAFRNLKFTVVLDIPEAEARERTLGIAPIRPASFFNHVDPQVGFIAFQKQLSGIITATRERRSESYELVDTLATMPALLYPLALSIFGSGIKEIVGSVGISVLRDTSTVSAAQSDIHTDGFLGFGRFDLPTEDGRLMGAVNVRGPQARVEAYLDAVRAVAAGDICLSTIVPAPA
jgi:hypothetical protein